MTSRADLIVELDPSVGEALAAEALATGRPAATIVNDLVRDFVEKQRSDRQHDDWLRVEIQQGMREADDRNEPRVPHADVMKAIEAVLAPRTQRIGKNAD